MPKLGDCSELEFRNAANQKHPAPARSLLPQQPSAKEKKTRKQYDPCSGTEDRRYFCMDNIDLRGYGR